MPPSDIKLITNKANFTRLDQLLSQEKWRAADGETGELMCKIMAREKENWLREEDCQNFPREELKIIDHLWIKYSNEKFGFSIQKKIWIACGGTPGLYNYDVYVKFADTVGWRKEGNWLSYIDLTFDRNVPYSGHIPSLFPVIGWWSDVGVWEWGWGETEKLWNEWGQNIPLILSLV
jgi:hypothetical protein